MPRRADCLPRLFSKWGQQRQPNGDSGIVRRGDRWVNLRDIGWTPEPGEQIIRYDDPLYDGDATTPRAPPAQLLGALRGWAGATGRARLALALGREVHERPVVLAGDPDIGTSRAGFTLFGYGGDTYGYRSIRKVGPFALIRHLRFQTGHRAQHPESGTRCAAAVAI